MAPPPPVVVCLGEALIDFVAQESGLTLEECPGFIKAAGGGVANVAVGLGRLGARPRFLGKVGDEPFGRFLQLTLEEAGVDVSHMRFDVEARTGLAFVSLTADGEREFVFFRNPSADMLYAEDEVDAAAFAGAGAFHFSSLTLAQEPSRSATLRGVDLARERGCVVHFDPNLRPALWDSLDHARDEICSAMRRTDVLKVSEEEAEFLVGSGDPATQAARLAEAGPRVVCLTLAERGVFCRAGEVEVAVPGFTVDVVDTTGAGDGFVAGLLSQLTPAGASPLSQPEAEWWTMALRFANAVGAMTCTRRGAVPALPWAAEVAAFLEAKA